MHIYASFTGLRLIARGQKVKVPLHCTAKRINCTYFQNNLISSEQPSLCAWRNDATNRPVRSRAIRSPEIRKMPVCDTPAAGASRAAPMDDDDVPLAARLLARQRGAAKPAGATTAAGNTAAASRPGASSIVAENTQSLLRKQPTHAAPSSIDQSGAAGNSSLGTPSSVASKVSLATAPMAHPAPAQQSSTQEEERNNTLSPNEDDVPLVQRLLTLKRGPVKVDAAKILEVVASRQRKPAGEKKQPRANKQRRQVVNATFLPKLGQTTRPAESGASGNEGTASAADDDFRWWDGDADVLGDGSIKWTTLEHAGPLFAPPYVPHGRPLRIGGRDVPLVPEVEEVATFWAALETTDHAANPVFRANFWADFCGVAETHMPELAARLGALRLEDVDFGAIAAHVEADRTRKRNATKEEKAALRAEKLALEEKYGFALLDGRKERVGNFRIEPPGLFRGRGKHPKAGKLKTRVRPEDVTINIGPGAPVPHPPPGTSWAAVVTDPTVTWLAMWVENINRAQKYVFLAPGSSLKGQSDLRKFETARKLCAVVAGIRARVAEELHAREMAVRQRATALWLIDRLALRAGNEKGDDEADTVGCCSLRREHVRLEPPSTLVLDFLGKDSIRYTNAVAVDPAVFRNMAIFMRPPKGPGDAVFDRLSTSDLNRYLTGLMPGLTAKVFRTFNASFTFEVELERNTAEVLGRAGVSSVSDLQPRTAAKRDPAADDDFVLPIKRDPLASESSDTNAVDGAKAGATKSRNRKSAAGDPLSDFAEGTHSTGTADKPAKKRGKNKPPADAMVDSDEEEAALLQFEKSAKKRGRKADARSDPMADVKQETADSAAQSKGTPGSIPPGTPVKVKPDPLAPPASPARAATTLEQRQLINDLVLAYNRANRQVAVLCNHQRAVPKGHGQSMERLEARIAALRCERLVVRRALHAAAESPGEVVAIAGPDAASADEPGVSDAQLAEFLAAGSQQEDSQAELQADSQAADGAKRPRAPPKLPSTLEGLAKRFATLTGRIQAAEMQRTEREENKATALGTSKMNYIDPRLTAAWCRRVGVPIERLFNKTLRERFRWAMDVPAAWRFDPRLN